MSQERKQPPVQIGIRLFAVSLIAVAIISGLAVHFWTKNLEPQAYWSEVYRSGVISNTFYWTTTFFNLTRRMAVNWSATGVDRNALMHLWIYIPTSSEPYLVLEDVVVKQRDSITQLNLDTRLLPGSFSIEASILGFFGAYYSWEIIAYDRLFRP